MDFGAGAQRRVLVCADWFNVMLLKQEFEGRHWAVSATEDEKEAFAFLGTHHYDLIVIEARPPYHDAFHTLKQVRGELHVLDTPVLVVTDGIDKEMEARFKWFSPVGALHMPFIGPDFDWADTYDERNVKCQSPQPSQAARPADMRQAA